MRKDKVIRTKNQGQMFYYIWFIVVVALLMMCLMWSVYSIPVGKIRENVHQSYVEIEQTAHHQKDYAQVDFFTDSIMLNIAFFKGRGNPLYDALTNPRIESLGPLLASKNLAIAVFLKNLHIAVVVNYPRYWHGYFLFLKPLLVFFDLQGIRYVNLVFQLGALFLIVYLMYKRLGFMHCVAFLTAMCFLNPITSWMCLHYANVVNVMLSAILWVLLNKNPDDKYMFFVIGAVTVFFDLLSFPLVTLGIPLLVYLSLYERGFKGDVVCVIKNSLLWLFGYAGMWFSKWGLASLFTDQNVIRDGWESVIHRTYGRVEWDLSNKDIISPLNSIKLNLLEIANLNALMFCAFFIVFMVLCYFIKSYHFRWNNVVYILLGIGLMPFVWYSVLVNHSVIHAHIFTHKILAVSVYAILTSVVVCLEPKKSLKTKI